MEGSASLLPIDALRHIFGCLDWRSLVSCSCVCRNWSKAAHDERLWLTQLKVEHYRPVMAAYSAAHMPAGWQDPSLAASTAAAAAGVSILGLLQRSNGSCNSTSSTEDQGRLQDSIRASQLLQDLFAAGKLHAAVPHQALLSRFSTALSQITGWRLLLTHSTAHSHSNTPAHDAANITPHLQNLSLCQPSDAPTSSAAAASHSHNSSMCQSCDTANFSSSMSAVSNASMLRSHTPADGHPVPLTLQALQSGGWVCGCVMMQQQEQSCWIRFNLPPELRTDPSVAQALLQGHLIAIVQGLGPSGWFDVVTADKFELSDNDMEILLQSHRTGFYAWDHVDEDGVDRYGQLESLPWDLTPGQQQQQQQQQQRQPPSQALPHLPAEEQQPQQHGQQQQQVQTQAGAQQHQQQQQQAQDGLGPDQPIDAGLPQLPQLRMLVYIHYEQLLQVLPWDLPHSLPLPAGPVLHTAMDLSRHLLSGWCSLWLQLDVCQLHGGFKLGTCVVPLTLRNWDAHRPRFGCIEDQVLVVVHTPDSSINSTKGVAAASGVSCHVEAAAGTGTAAAAAGPAQPGVAESGTASSSSSYVREGQAGSVAATTAGGRLHSLLQVLNLKACQQVLLGDACLHGAGNCNAGGSIIRTAANALQDMMNRDEIMVDFALFDVKGHLLMGRAGVEVWNQELTESASIQEPGQQSTASCSAVAHSSLQDTAATGMHLSHQQAPRLRSAPPPCPSVLQKLARCIGPIVPKQDKVAREQGDACDLAHAAASQAEDSVAVEAASVGSSSHLTGSQHHTAPMTEITHMVHKLHFLVDDVQGDFWDTCIVVDVDHTAPAASIMYGTGLPCSTISMRMSWDNLRGLFGLTVG